MILYLTFEVNAMNSKIHRHILCKRRNEAKCKKMSLVVDQYVIPFCLLEFRERKDRFTSQQYVYSINEEKGEEMFVFLAAAASASAFRVERKRRAEIPYAGTYGNSSK